MFGSAFSYSWSSPPSLQFRQIPFAIWPITFLKLFSGCLVSRSSLLGRSPPHSPSLQLLASCPQTLQVKTKLHQKLSASKLWLQFQHSSTANKCDKCQQQGNACAKQANIFSPRAPAFYNVHTRSALLNIGHTKI